VVVSSKLVQNQFMTHFSLRRVMANGARSIAPRRAMLCVPGIIFFKWPKTNVLKPLMASIILVLLMVPAANATILFPLSIEELTSKAQVVLHGSVGSKSVQRDPEGRIYTRIELEVTEAWKGKVTGKSFTLVQGGGVLGEEIATVEGQEEFSIGEEVVVFLVLNQRGEGVVIGLSQGKFKVKAGEAGGEKVVHNLFHGGGSTAEAGASAKAKGARLSISDLKQRVQGGAR
jgi:hypothetical protein